MNKNCLSIFLKEKLYQGKLTGDRIENILRSFGFEIISFASDNPLSLGLVKAYRLEKKAEFSESFIYCCKNKKYIFIRDHLSDRDRAALFLHELGHVCYDHLTTSDGIFDTKVFKELQAHAFCLTVLFLNRVMRFFKPIVICLFFVLLFFVVPTDDPTLGCPVPSEPAQVATEQVSLQDPKEEAAPADPLTQQIVYWSPGGEVYHLDPNCQHLINAIETQSGTIADCDKKRCCYSCQKYSK